MIGRIVWSIVVQCDWGITLFLHDNAKRNKVMVLHMTFVELTYEDSFIQVVRIKVHVKPIISGYKVKTYCELSTPSGAFLKHTLRWRQGAQDVKVERGPRTRAPLWPGTSAGYSILVGG